MHCKGNHFDLSYQTFYQLFSADGKNNRPTRQDRPIILVVRLRIIIMLYYYSFFIRRLKSINSCTLRQKNRFHRANHITAETDDCPYHQDDEQEQQHEDNG